jgi:adenylate cyclase
MGNPFLPGLHTFLRELKRRRVVRVAVVYAVVGYGVLEVAGIFFPALHLPAWTVTFTAALVVIGFPAAVVLAWAYDITPDGVKRTPPAATQPHAARSASGRRAAAYLMLGFVLALGGLGLTYQQFNRPHVSDGGAAETMQSIAVLPFLNLSTDADNEAFSDGLTEELLNALAQVKGLRVPARTSSFAFKNVHVDITEIGRKLKVDLLLEGSVRRAGDRLRITAQLIRAADGSHLWSQTYDRAIADVFEIQEDIANAIVGQLLPRVGVNHSEAELVRAGTDDLDAYQAFLSGRHQFWQQGGEQGLRAAASHFETAIQRDPEYAIAWAGLSDALMLLGGSGFAPPHDVFPQSKAAANRAIELDTRLAEGYVALASINWLYDWDWAAAASNYRRSFSVNPLLHTRCVCYAWYLAVTGDRESAMLEAERARSLDPLARLPLVISSWMYYLGGRFPDARATLAELFAMNATDVSGRRINAWMAWDEGRRADAIAELEKVRADADARGGFGDTSSPVVVADLATMYARFGREEDAQRLLHALSTRARRQYIPAEYIAAVHAALGAHDEAFRWLEDAFSERSNLAQFNVLPLSQPMRAHPRYQQIMARVGLPAPALTAARED